MSAPCGGLYAACGSAPNFFRDFFFFEGVALLLSGLFTFAVIGSVAPPGGRGMLSAAGRVARGGKGVSGWEGSGVVVGGSSRVGGTGGRLGSA